MLAINSHTAAWTDPDSIPVCCWNICSNVKPDQAPAFTLEEQRHLAMQGEGGAITPGYSASSALATIRTQR